MNRSRHLALYNTSSRSKPIVSLPGGSKLAAPRYGPVVMAVDLDLHEVVRELQLHVGYLDLAIVVPQSGAVGTFQGGCQSGGKVEADVGFAARLGVALVTQAATLSYGCG